MRTRSGRLGRCPAGRIARVSSAWEAMAAATSNPPSRTNPTCTPVMASRACSACPNWGMTRNQTTSPMTRTPKATRSQRGTQSSIATAWQGGCRFPPRTGTATLTGGSSPRRRGSLAMLTLRYSRDELMEDHDYVQPQVVDGRRMHGGFLADGTYQPPRTKVRGPAIEAWTKALRDRGGEIFDADASLLDGVRLPSVDQQRVLLRNGLGESFWHSLDRKSVVSGKSGSVRVEHGGGRSLMKKTKNRRRQE